MTKFIENSEIEDQCRNMSSLGTLYNFISNLRKC